MFVGWRLSGYGQQTGPLLQPASVRHVVLAPVAKPRLDILETGQTGPLTAKCGGGQAWPSSLAVNGSDVLLASRGTCTK